MHKPKVSIIIPNYNHAKFLVERLESVFNQIFQDFEVIILDDCSTDNSVEILKNYSNHEKVSHFEVNKKNSGSVFKQWIKGIKLAKGEFIWIAESDDLADKDFLTETLKFAELKNNVGLVFTKSYEIDELGIKTGTIYKPKFNNDINQIYGLELISKYLIENLVIVNASSVLFKASKLKEINFTELAQFKNTGDRYTYVSLATHSKLYYLDKGLNFFRNHSNNTTKKNIENSNIYKDRLKVLYFFIPLTEKNKLASDLSLKFYFKQSFLYFQKLSYKENFDFIDFLNSNRLINKYLSIRLKIFVLIFGSLKEKTPHRLRIIYKNTINNKLNIQI